MSLLCKYTFQDVIHHCMIMWWNSALLRCIWWYFTAFLAVWSCNFQCCQTLLMQAYFRNLGFKASVNSPCCAHCNIRDVKPCHSRALRLNQLPLVSTQTYLESNASGYLIHRIQGPVSFLLCTTCDSLPWWCKALRWFIALCWHNTISVHLQHETETLSGSLISLSI